MRTITFCLLMLAALGAGCGPGESDTVSGTYVREANDQLFTMFDTIRIVSAGKAGTSYYRISKTVRVIYKNPADTARNFLRTSRLQGTYDATAHIMNTEDPGIRYEFDFPNGTLTSSQNQYRKLN